MNNDLISREALKKAIEQIREDYIEDNFFWLKLFKIIENAPTVDTTCPHCDSGYAQGYSDGYLRGKEERPQGKWITVSRNCWKCPYCQELTNEGKNFCPNCGAKMKGGAV